MSRIEERLEIMGVQTSGMTDEEKFTAATGLTRYDADMAANDWYVPAGAANTPNKVITEPEEQEETPTTYTAETAAAYNATLSGAKTTSDWKVEPAEGVHYTEEEVLEANAALEGALEAGEPLTEEQAAAYNIAVTGAKKEADNELTAEEAAMYNANLEGAISTEDYKVEPVEGVHYTQEEADAYNATLDGAVKEGDPVVSTATVEG